MVLLFSLTASYAQTGNDTIPNGPLLYMSPQGDTLLCYTIEEARKIAMTEIKYHRCDSLQQVNLTDLYLADSTIAIQDSIIQAQDSTIQDYQEVSILKEQIIQGKNKEIVNLRLDALKMRRRRLGLTIGIVTLGVGTVATLVWALTK